MLRRGLALGAGLLVLILLVLGVRGCLNARKHRALSDYAENVTQIVDETDRTGKAFFEKLSDPGALSVTEFVAEVNADRSAMDNYRARVEALDTPGDMGSAQGKLELVYELRGSAMNEIADEMSTALGDVGSEQAIDGDRQADERAAGERRRSTRRSSGPRSTACSPPTASKATTCRRAPSSPDGIEWLDEGNVSSALGSVSGSTGAGTPGVHGLGLTRPASTAPN